jgi:hypothetical protein
MQVVIDVRNGILRRILREQCVNVCGLDSYGSGDAPVVGSCENDKRPSGSVRGGEIHNWFSNHQLLKKKPDPIHGVSYFKGTTGLSVQS